MLCHATACFRNIAWTMFPVSKSMPCAQLRITSAILGQGIILASKCLLSRPNKREERTSVLSSPIPHTGPCFDWTGSYFWIENSRHCPRGVTCVLNETARTGVRQFWSGTLKWRGTAVAQWLRYCATNRKVAGSIPDGVIEIFHWHNPSDRTMDLESTQPVTEMSTRSISWG
jgi:hypothetical protein